MKGFFLLLPLSFMITVSLSLAIPESAYAARLKACLKAETGKIAIRRRCRAAKGQQEVNAELLQGLGATQVGPQGPAGPKGSVGPKGEKGDQGDKGDRGLNGVTGHEIVTAQERTVLGIYENYPLTEVCPAGKAVLSRRCTEEESGYIDPKSSSISADGTEATCVFENRNISMQQYGTMVIDIVCGPVE